MQKCTISKTQALLWPLVLLFVKSFSFYFQNKSSDIQFDMKLKHYSDVDSVIIGVLMHPALMRW